MDTRLEALAGSQGGVFAAHEALAAGLTRAYLHRALRARKLVRVRRGAYVHATVWQAASRDERYRLGCLAVARSRPGDALSHHAALAVLGLSMWGHDLGRIDLVTDTVQSVRRGSVWLHADDGVAVAPVADAVCVSPARAVVRTALTMGQDCAVVAGRRRSAPRPGHPGRSDDRGGRHLAAPGTRPSPGSRVAHGRQERVGGGVPDPARTASTWVSNPTAKWSSVDSGGRLRGPGRPGRGRSGARVRRAGEVRAATRRRGWCARVPRRSSGWRSAVRTRSAGSATLSSASSGTSWSDLGSSVRGSALPRRSSPLEQPAPPDSPDAATHRAGHNAPRSDPGELGPPRCVAGEGVAGARPRRPYAWGRDTDRDRARGAHESGHRPAHPLDGQRRHRDSDRAGRRSCRGGRRRRGHHRPRHRRGLDRGGRGGPRPRRHPGARHRDLVRVAALLDPPPRLPHRRRRRALSRWGSREPGTPGPRGWSGWSRSWRRTAYPWGTTRCSPRWAPAPPRGVPTSRTPSSPTARSGTATRRSSRGSATTRPTTSATTRRTPSAPSSSCGPPGACP